MQFSMVDDDDNEVPVVPTYVQDRVDSEQRGVQMYDRIEIDDAAKVHFRSDGSLLAFPRVARTGIQLYKGSELGRPDLDTVKVYRPPEEVFKKDTLASFTHRATTLDHPPELVNPNNWKKYSTGHTGDEVVRDGNSVRVPMMISDGAAIQAWKSGTHRQLSQGYVCDIKWGHGTTPSGEEFDAVQSGILGNHTAQVGAARGGELLSLDSATNDGEDDMNAPTLKSVIVDGIPLQVPDTAAGVIERTISRMQATIDEFTKKAKGKDDEDDAKKKQQQEDKAKTDAAIAAKDAEIATLKKAVADSALTPERLNTLVTVRANTVAKSKAMLGDSFKPETMADADIHKAVASKFLGDAVCAGYTADQYRVAFDALAARVNTGNGATVTDAARAFSTPTIPQPGYGGGNVSVQDASYASMTNELSTRWMGDQQPKFDAVTGRPLHQ